MEERIPIKEKLGEYRYKIKGGIKHLLLYHFHEGYNRWCRLCEMVSLIPRTWEQYLENEHWIWNKINYW